MPELLPVVRVHACPDIGFHLLREGHVRGKNPAQILIRVFHQLKNIVVVGVLIENADKLIIDAQGAYQILLPPFLFASFLFLLKFLGRAVQKKALAYNLAVLLHQLGIAHHMQLFAVRMFDTVFITRAVADLFQLTDGRHELGFVLIHDRAGDHLEAFGLHLVKGSEIQQIQGCPVDADDVRPIQRMAQDAAIHGGEHGFQRGIVS